MALSGSFYDYPVVRPSHNFGLYCEWTGSQSISGNYTDITMDVYLCYYSIAAPARQATVSVDGDSETYTVPAINHYPNKSYKKLIKTYTVRVEHDNDGTKSCELSATYQFDGTYAGTNVGTITASTTVTLDTIARASSITSVSNVTLGNSCGVTWTPNSSSFRYKIAFVLGNWSYTTDYISPNRTSSYTYTDYTLPVSVSSHLPNATSGTMTARLYTYNGSTQVGSYSSKTFTVYVPSTVVPTITAFSVSPDNSANSTIEEWGVYVSGYTKAKLSASASGVYSSSISSYSLRGTYTGTVSGSALNYTGSTLTSSGTKTFTIYATDTRGRSSLSMSKSVTVYAYSNPNVSAFTVSRSSTNVKKVTVLANWSCSDVGGRNSATATLMYKRSTSSAWTTYGTISRGASVTLSTDFDEQYSYNFRIVVRDALGNTSQADMFISTAAVLMDFRQGGKGLGIGKIAESDSLEVALNSIFMGDVYIRVGSDNVLLKTYIKNVINGVYL